jgi:hypothetical protein
VLCIIGSKLNNPSKAACIHLVAGYVTGVNPGKASWLFELCHIVV